MKVRADYDVSVESVFIRLIHLTEQPVAIFVSSRIETGSLEGRYRIDYAMKSRSSSLDIERGLVLPEGSAVEECTAIGFTAKKEEFWPVAKAKLPVECVGIPPYPGRRYPRVVGLLLAPQMHRVQTASITCLVGDATEPRGTGNRIVVHVVNDRTPRWGGGFALVARKKWPLVQDDFVAWAEADKARLRLGNTHFATVQEGLTVCSMVSQHGYGPSPTPRIRYEALEKCLTAVAEESRRLGASVHMPRIGCGQAGGSWGVISELLEDTLCQNEIPVTVYDLPGQEFLQKKDDLLFR
jgi:O-acetyl-ADP-ribose deacetylase (regulator of RNase III)